jgi:lipocalin
MDSMIKWLGPGAVLGGLGAAVFCGAGLAGADPGGEARSADRAAHAGASTAGADKPARTPRPARVAASRVDPSQPPASRLGAAPPSAPAAEVPLPRVTPAAAERITDNDPPASLARASAAPAAATPAAAVPVSPPPAAAATAASGPVVPSSVPVDPAQFAGTYYEQGSVKQLFSIGLVNTKAVYTLRPDGTLGVRNSGNYFFRWGPRSSISGSAVAVNPINTALNVGFGGSTPSANPPGNYLILDRAPDYGWLIVSDPSGRSGFILTRSQTVDRQTYQQLVAQARALGVSGRITPTRQIPG